MAFCQGVEGTSMTLTLCAIQTISHVAPHLSISKYTSQKLVRKSAREISMASAASSSSPAMLSFSSIPQSLPHSPFLATPIHKPSLASTKRAFNALSTITCSSHSHNSLLLQAAKHTVDSYVKSGMVIGLGSGNASALAIQYLGLQLRSGAVEDVVGIPTSVGSASEAAKAGIPLEQYEESSKIDLAFDDADIIEEETLSAVIGRRTMHGEESIIQEKAILKASGKLVFIATDNQFKGALDGSVPVLIRPFNWLETAEEIDDLFLGDAEVWRRPSVGHADPLGGDFPLVTRDGYNILDVIFTSPIQSLAEVGGSLDKVIGVVDHGIICKIPCAVVIASPNGVQIIDNTEMIGSSRGQS